MKNNRGKLPKAPARMSAKSVWAMWGNLFVLVIVILCGFCAMTVSARTITDSSPLDNLIIRPLFHKFRNFTFGIVGPTSLLKRTGKFYQTPLRRFPCDTSLGRSREPPTSVHKLRPGDIDIIAAMGDSLTAATGATSTAFMDLFIDNRGLSWCIGGQWSYRNSTTLPNILKEFNPNLFGYSVADSYPFHLGSQFNVAEIGGVSSDMMFMARTLIKRIKADPRTDFKRHWKMLTISIGGNDLCSFSCTWKNPESLPEKHRRNLIQALRIIRDNMPRTYVNLVSVPSIETVIGLRPKPQECAIMHHMECSCWVGPLYNKTQKLRERLARIQQNVIRVEQEVADMEEFKNLKEFALVHQPFTLDISMSDIRRKTDYSLLAYDCFHMSQKGNALAGISLWNNILEPVGGKTNKWRPAIDMYPSFRCPTRESPYLFTHRNSRG